MEDFDLNIVAKKSIRGVFALVTRSFLVYALGIIANFVLWAYLDPSTYGVFFIVSSIVVFLTYFQDIGLAASLIQKKEEPTTHELRTVFTIQQILVLIVVIPGLIFSQQISDFYSLKQEGMFLFVAFLLAFLLSSLKTIPTVILERRLDFHKLVFPQIIENVVYNGVLIWLVIAGFGISGFTIAVLARGLIGLIVIYVVSPWSIGLSFRFDTLKRLLLFGLPFQTNSILALVKDDLLNLYIGKLLPLSQVGYVGFAKKLSFLPTTLIMDNVIKTTFPSYSRLQHDQKALKVVVEKSLFLISFFIFPTIVGIIMFSPSLIRLIPKYNQWEQAIPSIVFFALNIMFASVTVPITNFLNAVGRVKITLYFMVFLTIATWGLTPLFILLFGFNGVSLASFLVAASLLLVLPFAKRFVNFSFIDPIKKQLIAAMLMIVFVYFSRFVISSLPLLVFHIIISGAFYLAIMFFIAREELITAIKFITSSIRNK